MRQVVDVSNFDWPFDLSVAACLKGSGIEGVIVGAQSPSVSRIQIGACRVAGLPVIGIYAEPDVAKAVGLAHEFGVERVWLVCEAGSIMNPAELQAGRARVEHEGLKAGIYTGGPWWRQMGDSHDFADLPLWFPSYFPDRRYIDTVDFGGWTKVAIHQYSSTRSICGRKRDEDVVFDWFEEEENMPDPRVDEILRALTGRDGADAAARIAAWNTSNGANTDNSLLDGYLLQQQAIGKLQAAPAAELGGIIDGDTVTLTRVKKG